ncbi:MAG: cold-shock protein [candidate division Zixibacteria bacterium]|nr:cold-shock protein [Candidatus Tariuqbacter arcticus]
MPVGKVKWFDKKKGFGFIEDAEMNDVFVHFSDIVGKGYRVLAENDKVEYELVQGPKGNQAKKVRVILKAYPDF